MATKSREHKELTWFEHLYKPEFDVEPSFFFYPNRGRKGKMPPRTMVTMMVDDFVHQFIKPEELEGFAEPLIIVSGIFLRCVTLTLYLYFIISTYYSQANVTFISTDPTSGICYRPPVAITNTFTFDVNGNWDVALAFNPTLGMYSVKMNNFLHSQEEYAAFILDAETNFKNALSNKAPGQDLATNLLNWMMYSYFVGDGAYTHRWRTTGDPKVVYDRTSYLGTVASSSKDCRLPSTTSYDRATGIMTLSYNYAQYVYSSTNSGSYCDDIFAPTDLGYNAVADGPFVRINWDVVSLTLARAVNKGVFPMSKLVKAKSGFSSEQFTVNGVVYTKTTLIDDAFPNMQPIICFEPNLASVAPTAAPTSFAYYTQVEVVQNIAGVSLAVATSAAGQAAITAAIAAGAGAQAADVKIVIIRATTGARRCAATDDRLGSAREC